MTNLSKVPRSPGCLRRLRRHFAFLQGGFTYLIYKLIFRRSFSVGIAPALIRNLFLSSILLVFLGILGEYIGAIHTHVQLRPYVIELERINFDLRT